MIKPDGGPAFPSEQGQRHDGCWNQTHEPGISVRDYFAAKADISWSDARAYAEHAAGRPPTMAQVAVVRARLKYEEADAMLAEREKE